jgi:hypothetical protein
MVLSEKILDWRLRSPLSPSLIPLSARQRWPAVPTYWINKMIAHLAQAYATGADCPPTTAELYVLNDWIEREFNS